MSAAEPDRSAILADMAIATTDAGRPVAIPIAGRAAPQPELIRLTPPAAFDALVREIASRSTL